MNRMEGLYLREVTKEFYSDALALIRNCNLKGWGLSPGLDEYIDLANKSPNVRTMFSNREGLNSYLKICYTEEVESKILIDINAKLKGTFTRSCEYRLHILQPRTQSENIGADPCLKYIVNPKYWNINHVKFELLGGSSDDHDSFWTVLSDELSKL